MAERGSRNDEKEWFPHAPNFNVATKPELARSRQSKIVSKKKHSESIWTWSLIAGNMEIRGVGWSKQPFLFFAAVPIISPG